MILIICSIFVTITSIADTVHHFPLRLGLDVFSDILSYSKTNAIGLCGLIGLMSDIMHHHFFHFKVSNMLIYTNKYCQNLQVYINQSFVCNLSLGPQRGTKWLINTGLNWNKWRCMMAIINPFWGLRLWFAGFHKWNINQLSLSLISLSLCVCCVKYQSIMCVRALPAHTYTCCQ